MCRYWDVAPPGFEHVTPMQYKAMQGIWRQSGCVAGACQTDHISLSLALSGRADPHDCSAGHERHDRRLPGTHAGPRGRQPDDEASQAPLRREHSLRGDRGEVGGGGGPVFLTSCLCGRAEPSGLCLLRSPWRSSSTLRCAWRDSRKLPVIRSWPCRSIRTRTLRSSRLVPPGPFGAGALSTAGVCVPVPLRGRDDAGHGLRRHHLPGSVAKDPAASRLSTFAWNLGAAGVPRPRFIRAKQRDGAAVCDGLKTFPVWSYQQASSPPWSQTHLTSSSSGVFPTT